MKNSLLKVCAVFVMSLLLMGGVKAQNKMVLYLYNPALVDAGTSASPEMPVADFIASLGYEVKMFGTPNLLNCTQLQLDSLRNADLIVIGRGLGSSNFNGHQDSIWNLLTTPVLSLNMFAVRPNTLKWFDGSEDYGGDQVDKKVKVNIPGDAVFAGLTMPDDSLVFWSGKWNSLKLNSASNNGNGTIMASFNSSDPLVTNLFVAYVRFNPGVEFYALSAPLSWTNHAPAGYRTFMGMGADTGGGTPFNYFGFSFDAQDVLKNEIARLIALEKPTGINNAKASSIVNVYPNPAASRLVVEMVKLSKVNIMDITGKNVLSVKANGEELSVNISSLKPGVYFVKAIDKNNNRVVKRIIKK